MTLIELGEIADHAPPPTPPVDTRRVLQAGLALVALAGSLVLTGSARTAPPTVQPLWRETLGGADGGLPGGDAAFLTRRAHGRGELVARELATGKVRWVAPLGERLGTFTPSPESGLVLVSVDPVQVSWDDGTGSHWISYSRATVAVDAATGAQRWRTVGEFGPATAGATGLAAAYAGHGLLTGLRLIRFADGHQLWHLPVANATAWTIVWNGEQPRFVATLTPDGEITVLRYADGTLVHRGRVPGSDHATELAGAGDNLALRVRNERVTLLRPEDLSEVWHTDAEIGYLAGCGPLLCSIDGHGVAGRDPATGREIWRQADMNGFRDAAPGRLLLADGSPGGIVRLVDPATGEPVGGILYGAPADGSAAGSILITRRTREQSDQQVVLRLDTATGALSTLGLMPSTGDLPCSVAGRYLVCTNEVEFSVTAVG